MRKTIFLCGLLTLACRAAEPGTLAIDAEAAQGGVALVAPGQPLGPVVVSRVGADMDELQMRLPVTLTHDGSGELRGSTEGELLGRATTFTELRYFGCGSFRITATVADDRIEPATTGPILVAPAVEVVRGPIDPGVDASGEIEPIVARLVDGEGGSLELEGIALRLVSTGGLTFTDASVTEASTDASGLVAFTGLELTGSGLAQLRIESAEPTCPIQPVDAGLVALGSLVDRRPLRLRSGRVGVPYRQLAFQPDDGYRETFIAPGLSLEMGEAIAGIPTEVGTFDGAVYRLVDGMVERIRTRVAIFPEHDPELPEPVDPVSTGEHAVDTTTLTLPSVMTRGGVLTDVAVRVVYPSDGAGAVAEGRWPAVVFAPALAEAPALYDQYTELHDHWASHGMIVYSVDASGLIADPSSHDAVLDQLSLSRAVFERLQTEDTTATSPFFEAHDLSQVFAAGHASGGGGALMLAKTEHIAGVLAFAPVFGELAAAREGMTELLGRDLFVPVMVVVGSDDRVVPWPWADLAGNATLGPSAIVTIFGANHLELIDEAAPQTPLTASRITRAERRAIERRYTTAFLRRFGHGELGFEATLFMDRGQRTDLSALGVAVRARRATNTIQSIELFRGGGTAMAQPGSPWQGPLNTEIGIAADDFVVFTRGPVWIENPFGAGDYAVPIPGELSNRRSLVFDVTRDCAPPPADPLTVDDGCPEDAVDFEVVVEDALRQSSRVAISERLVATRVPGRHWVTVRIPLSDFTSRSGLDPAHLQQLLFDFGPEPDAGRTWIDEVRFE